MTAQTMQIGNRPCRIYGEAHAEYLLLQITGEHELQSMESEATAIAQSAHRFLFAAIPVESWNDALSPWEAPAVWGKESFGCNAADTLRFLTEQVIPSLMVMNGVSMKQVQEWLGHSTFSTTADIYAHLDYKSKQGSAGVIANLLGESKLPK